MLRWKLIESFEIELPDDLDCLLRRELLDNGKGGTCQFNYGEWVRLVVKGSSNSFKVCVYRIPYIILSLRFAIVFGFCWGLTFMGGLTSGQIWAALGGSVFYGVLCVPSALRAHRARRREVVAAYLTAKPKSYRVVATILVLSFGVLMLVPIVLLLASGTQETNYVFVREYLFVAVPGLGMGTLLIFLILWLIRIAKRIDRHRRYMDIDDK